MKVNDVLRMPHYDTMPNQYRVWLVVAVRFGGLGQEDCCELRCCDLLENEKINVPVIMLATHPGIFIYDVDKWISLPLYLARKPKERDE